MEEFLTSSSKQMWPYYLLAFVVGELLLVLRQKKGLALEIIVASGICFLLTVQGHYQAHNTWAMENRPVLLAVVNLLSILMPITALVITNQYLLLINSTAMKHFSLLVVVLITMFIWPLWALYITCASGLDCL